MRLMLDWTVDIEYGNKFLKIEECHKRNGERRGVYQCHLYRWQIGEDQELNLGVLKRWLEIYMKDREPFMITY